MLQADPSRTPAPRHVWSRHTLPITDLHCGFGGPLARVATASLDQTVKVGPSLCHVPRSGCELSPAGRFLAQGSQHIMFSSKPVAPDSS